MLNNHQQLQPGDQLEQISLGGELDDMIVIPKMAIPSRFLGDILVQHLSEKYDMGSGITKKVARNGFTLDWTPEWEARNPADAILAKAANILITRSQIASKARIRTEAA